LSDINVKIKRIYKLFKCNFWNYNVGKLEFGLVKIGIYCYNCSMIQRKMRDRLLIALDNFRVVMLNGPRQSGKTTLVKKLADELGMDYITLDDPDKLAMAQNDPLNFLSFYAKKPLVID